MRFLVSLLCSLVLMLSVVLPAWAAEPMGSCSLMWFNPTTGGSNGYQFDSTKADCLNLRHNLVDPYAGGGPVGVCSLSWVGWYTGDGRGYQFDATQAGCLGLK